MAVFTQDEITKYAGEVLDGLGSDGKLHLSQVPHLIGLFMEIVEQVSTMSNEDKKESVISLVDYVLEHADIPWVPKAFVIPLLEQMVPAMVEKLIDATKGRLNVNLLPGSTPAAPTPAPQPPTPPSA